MRSVEGLVNSMSATEGELAGADALCVEHNLAINAGINMAPMVWETVCARAFSESRVKGDWTVCLDLLLSKV